MTTTAPKTNEAGFVEFSSRSSARKGDRYTWARYNAKTRELTVNLAGSGLLSEEYLAEFGAFCGEYGIDFDAMRRGDKITVIVPAEEPAAAETSAPSIASRTNDAGFVKFHNRSSLEGDRHTWARYNADTRELTVYLANTGRISPEYMAEFEAFCREYGIDFDAMCRGDKITVIVPAEEPAAAEATAEQTAEAVEAVTGEAGETADDEPMSLVDCVKVLMSMDNADELRLNDGAVTWDLSNLYDALVSGGCDDDERRYCVQSDGIYCLDDGDRGILPTTPDYWLFVDE